MKYVVWNKTQDLFWSRDGGWSNRHYAQRYAIEELEKNRLHFLSSDDVIVALIALSV